VRQIVQILFFVLYIYLLLAALQRWAIFPQADLFFRLNPLAALTAMLASRAWIPRLGLALLTVALTILLGRVWCGWLCPLGTLLEWVRFPGARRRAGQISPHWRVVKNVVLLLTLAMALFGSLHLLIFDPITLLTRTMTTAVLPALNYAITATERVLYPLPVFSSIVDWVEGALRGSVLPVEQSFFAQNVFIVALFFGLLALNFLADRFWCRYLCPLGALLGLLSKVALLRPVIGSACVSCAKCARVCPTDAIDTEPDYEITPAECTVCLDCLAACPKGDMGFAGHWRPAPLRETDPTRRQVLASLAAGAVSVALLQTGAQAKQPHPHLIRPPGVEDEDEFLSQCIRCSKCMAVCPTQGLQPTLYEAGLEGLWTPQLVPRLGYCDYGCNACGQICPSGAIPLLDLESKRQAIMGLAAVDQSRCLPWAYDTPCIVCEEMCPVPDKAIRLQTGEGGGHGLGYGRGGGGRGLGRGNGGGSGQDDGHLDTDEEGGLQKPFVIADLCIGCGICEQHCPVEDEAAIRVYRWSLRYG
jgi:polyferredoxin